MRAVATPRMRDDDAAEAEAEKHLVEKNPTTQAGDAASDDASTVATSSTNSTPTSRMSSLTEASSSSSPRSSDLSAFSNDGHERADVSSWRVGLTVRNMYKLKTREDPNNFHKILGVLCLLHYVYRFACALAFGTMRFEDDSPQLMALWILLHGALSWSSFIFHLPSKRNKYKPMIWPELRFHNAVFATRSLVDAALHGAGLGHVWQLRVCVVFATMLAADAVTNHYKRLALVEKQDSTMRGMPFPDGVPEWARTKLNEYYAVSQLFATLGALNISRAFATDVELAFTTLFAIQISALLMTLVRKSILTPAGWHFWYAVSLGVSWVWASYRYSSGQPSLASLAVRAAGTFAALSFSRFVAKINKYVLWAVVAFVDVTFQSKAYAQESHPFWSLWSSHHAEAVVQG